MLAKNETNMIMSAFVRLLFAIWIPISNSIFELLSLWYCFGA